jgi:hypothetical protein
MYKIQYSCDGDKFISTDCATKALELLDEDIFEISDTQYDGKEGLLEYLNKNENLEEELAKTPEEDREEEAATAAIQRLVDDEFIACSFSA